MNIPDSTIHCFEPSRLLNNALLENTESFPNIYIHQVALSDHDGEEPLFFTPLQTGQSSLKEEVNESGHHSQFIKENVIVRDAGRAFDELKIESVDILKVDTEGSEIEILTSLGQRLDQVKHIYLEYHSESDKNKIQEILVDFLLLHHQKQGEGVGVLKYMHRRLA